MCSMKILRSLLAALLLASFAGNAIAQFGQATAPSTLRSKIIVGSRDLTLAGGNVAYTGMGFQPTACEVIGSIGTNANYMTFFGMSDSTRTTLAASHTNSTANFNYSNTNFMVFADSTAGNSQVAFINSYDLDGLTITWQKNGSPTGTVNFAIRCR